MAGSITTGNHFEQVNNYRLPGKNPPPGSINPANKSCG
jgi:hypothetical protein